MTATDFNLINSISGYKSIDEFDFEKSKEWCERRIKGKICEILVEEMFKSMGFKVTPLGVESMMPHLLGELKNRYDEQSLLFKQVPDFSVFDPRHNEIFMIDVKYRSDGNFNKSRLNGNPYKNAYIVLVTPHHIKCALVSEIHDDKEIKPGRNKLLGDRKEFNFETKHRRIIHKYLRLCNNVFEKEPFTDKVDK